MPGRWTDMEIRLAQSDAELDGAADVMRQLRTPFSAPDMLHEMKKQRLSGYPTRAPCHPAVVGSRCRSRFGHPDRGRAFNRLPRKRRSRRSSVRRPVLTYPSPRPARVFRDWRARLTDIAVVRGRH